MKITIPASLGLGLSVICGAQEETPNIILIYADDVGYGDLSCQGAIFDTPNIDSLAANGLRFTSAYATAATCSPSRYSLLTGEYAFREPGTGIQPGDAGLIIDYNRLTLPQMLKNGNYKTGIVGKWHLGLSETDGGQDWMGEIKPGPIEVGFDYSFIMAATADRVPCVYIEGYEIVGLDPMDTLEVSYSSNFKDDEGNYLPTGNSHPEMLRYGANNQHSGSIVDSISRIGYFKGGNSALFSDEDMADDYTNKAVEFIKNNQDTTFFLYFASNDNHVPRYPHARFRGKSGISYREDAVIQLDWCVGRIVEVIDSLGLTDNTMIIFSSDNGPVLDDGYEDGTPNRKYAEPSDAHQPAGIYRGGKYKSYEGGTRLPFIVKWPGRVKPGVSDAIISQVDLFASFAALTEQELAEGQAPDSWNVLPAMLGDTSEGRFYNLVQGGPVSMRFKNWKYIPSTSGLGQLYDLSKDPSEQKNIANDSSEIAKALDAKLTQEKSKSKSIDDTLRIIEEPEDTVTIILQSNYEVIYYDSQETDGDPGHATNAIDGNLNSFWHTEWKNNKPGLPHEIQLYLGGVASIHGFRYIPRQDKINGTIGKYEIYVSEDKDNWGEPVATGTWVNNQSTKDVFFSSKKGRYVRLVALSEVTGKTITSAAELYVLGTGLVPDEVESIESLYGSGMENITVQPNPFSTEFTLKYNTPGYYKYLRIIDVNSKELVKKEIDSTTNNITVLTSSILANGVYFLQLFKENGEFITRKIMMQGK